jgi:inosose dehydratase
MFDLLSRRKFLISLSALTATSLFSVDALAEVTEEPLYPPIDLSYFEKPLTPAPASIKLGYAAITWGGNDALAIKEISEVGFRGIQIRANAVKEYGDRPQVLRDLLKQHHLEMVALSSGGVGIASSTEAEQFALHSKHAKFVREVGGQYLQVTDSARAKDRKPIADDFKQLGRMLTEIGKRTMDLGVPLGYHNHMGSLGEAPDEVARILDAADPRYVKLELDIAHYAQGGGDPVKAIQQYRERLLFLHIKDVVSPVPAGFEGAGSKPYLFVELGQGKVDVMGAFAALKKAHFRGWAVVELDGVPVKGRTPKESALISKKYLEEKLKLAL